MSYTINNPGGGDCGFYAFAIGLIDIIQHEYKRQGYSATFNCWQKEGLNAVSLQNIIDIDLNSLYQNRNYKKELLFILQMSLRASTVNATKSDLDSKIKAEASANDGSTKIEGSFVYCKFMELVEFYLKRSGTLRQIGQFNELALSSDVLKLAEKTAAFLKKNLNKNQSYKDIQTVENAHVKQILLDDVRKDNSLILKGLDKIKEKGRWAAHSDLKEIAELFHVNLQVVGQLNGNLIADYPTITLNNERNAHWTTVVDELPKLQQQAIPLKNKRATEDSSQQITNKKQRQSSLLEPTDRLFSIKEEQVIVASASSQIQQDKVDRYREHLKDLIHASSTLGLFTQVKNKIDVNAINTAQALVNESDESFAARLQEAELRRVHLT